MNICIISPRYPYKDNMEFVFVKKLVDEWANMGHRCVVITDFSWTVYLRKNIDFKPRYYRDEIAPNIFVDVYNPRCVTTRIGIKDYSFDSWITSKIIGRQLKKLKFKIDFIYCHFIGSAVMTFPYAKKHQIPLFIASGESIIPNLPRPSFKFTWEDFRNYTKGVISVSSKNKKEATERGLIIADKCEVFPNGTDTSIFKPLNKQDCRTKLGFPQNLFIVVCVGFFCDRKGQDRVLQAIRQIGDKNIKVVFLGKEAKLKPLFLEGEEILFKGSVYNSELPDYLNSADLFCLPTRAEGCCNAIIEALACGLPIVSSNLPFNWDVLDSSNSILVDPDNIDEIASAIKTLKDDKENRDWLAQGAINRSNSLSIRKRAESILQFIQGRISNNVSK